MLTPADRRSRAAWRVTRIVKAVAARDLRRGQELARAVLRAYGQGHKPDAVLRAIQGAPVAKAAPRAAEAAYNYWTRVSNTTTDPRIRQQAEAELAKLK